MASTPIIMTTRSMPEDSFRMPKVKRGGGVALVHAHAAEDQAHAAAQQALDHGAAGGGGDDGQGEEHEHGVLGGAELQGVLGDGLGDDHQDDAAEEAAEGGAVQGHLDSLARFALLAQRVAVRHGGAGGRRAGGADEDADMEPPKVPAL